MISSVPLAQAALDRGIKLKHINDYQQENAFMELNYKGHREYVQATNCSLTSTTANHIVNNKALAKDFLRRNGVQTPEGKLFLCQNIEEVKAFCKNIGYPVVFKKYNGTHGNLVFVGIENFKRGEEILRKYFPKEKYILVEKEFKGKEYRIVVTKEKVLAATYREPANVVGDGKSSIRELIAMKNKDHRRGDELVDTPLIRIKIDYHVKLNLEKQKLSLDSVVDTGEKIYLRNNSNISTGGDSIDVTEEIHPQLKRIAVKAINAIPGLAYAGIDLMVKEDISKNPGKDGYAILELNSCPGISMHHCPYEGKSRDVAGGIIDLLFPETKR